MQVCCEKDAYSMHEMYVEECTLSSAPEECMREAREFLTSALEQCRPVPPTCWEEANRKQEENVYQCYTNSTTNSTADVDFDKCMLNVGFMYNQNLQMCCEQEVWMEHEVQSKYCF